MQIEIPIAHRLSHIYRSYQAVRLLCLFALPGAAILLYLTSGGLPPWAWLLLAHTLPHIPALLALRGESVLLALGALLVLSLTILCAWLALFWLTWRVLACERERRGELRRFAAEMQRAQRLARKEEARAALHSQRRLHVIEQEETAPLEVPAITEQRSPSRLIVSTALDVGLKYKNRPNEDSLLAVQNTRRVRDERGPVGLFVIADGMGGHEHGQEASRLVVQSLSACILPVLSSGPADDDYAELLVEGVHRANLALYQCNREMQSDMGSTLAAALVVHTTAYIANVGDSRVYLYRARSGLSQITRDHSIVARLVETGVLQPADVYTHPRRNEIYRSLGHQASQEIDTFTLALQPDDLLLLCSDGLWEMVRDEQIEQILASAPTEPARLSEALVQAALAGGGKDNISVVLVLGQEDESAQSAWAS